ncbi:MAG: glycosyl transferase family 1 [Sulfurovum sp.]|nr:MAG: glycosyl transferase family 1 [Sulfurovum sp.]
MPNQRRLLYITDQDEYMDHSFIAPLFEIYLKKYLHIDIVYFTEFKSDFEHKDLYHFIVPSRYKNALLDELNRNNVDMQSYDYVMVRNNIEILEQVLRDRETYGYKALFRFSYPKRSIKISCAEAENKTDLLAPVVHHFKTASETNIINQCDAFLPTSRAMHKAFRPDVNITTILCPPAINPRLLYENEQHTEDEKRFVYVGTLDALREFETVLDAFSQLESKKWKLLISTRDTSYAEEMLENYPHIKDQIEICNAQTKEAMLELIAKSDIGVALLPAIPIYTTSTSVKIFDYYASAVPCLMANAEHTATIFTNRVDAWFCNFSKEDICKEIEYLITLSKHEVMKVGEKGQQRLLDIRNYETIAKTIAQKIETL